MSTISNPLSTEPGTAAQGEPRFRELLAAADRVAAELRSTAAERDRANGHPSAEVELLRAADLLQVQEPVEYGGSGLSFGQASIITRHVARGDTSIAHLLGYHYAQTRVAQLFGTPEQADALSRRNGEGKLFWGGIQNPRGGSDLVLTRDGDGFRLNGHRTFASGATLADQLSVTATLDGELVFVSLPKGKEGFNPLNDWDNIGQRLTDSGGVELNNVRIEKSEVLGEEPYVGGVPSAYQTLVTPHWQLAFVNFYIGTAEGAIAEALEWTRANAKPWETSGVERASDDPYILQTVGEVVAEVRAAALLADRAGEALDRALAVGHALTDEQRADAAIAIYEAKYLTTKVALDATSRVFEIQGARATTAAYGFDRHWRNVRTHTVHDPVAYKAREVGDWELGRPQAQVQIAGELLGGARVANAAAERGGSHAQDLRTRLLRLDDGSLRLTGTKYYCTGAISSDWIAVTAIDDSADERQQLVFVRRDAEGVELGDDWAAMGQRNTVSGTTVFADVLVDPAYVVPYWQAFASPQAIGARGQLIHAAIEVGIAGGSLRDAGAFLRDKSRPFFEAVRGGWAEQAADDPHTIYRFGQLSTKVAAAEALLRDAAAVVDRTPTRPSDPDAAAAASVAVARAKAFGSEVAVEVASELFAVAGTSATDEKYNLNRHWRNARTHSVHDPVSWKYHHIGAYEVSGTLPPNHGQI